MSSTESNQPAIRREIEIRFAGAGDLKDIAEILVDSFFPAGQFWHWTRPLVRLGIYEDLRGRANGSNPHYRCLVAVRTSETATGREEAIVATAEIALKTNSPLGRGIPYISNLAVVPDCRRCGIARKILGKCDRIALEWGFEELSLHVLDNNLAARELYFSSGYRLEKVDGWFGGWWFDRPRRLFLQKKLQR